MFHNALDFFACFVSAGPGPSCSMENRIIGASRNLATSTFVVYLCEVYNHAKFRPGEPVK